MQFIDLTAQQCQQLPDGRTIREAVDARIASAPERSRVVFDLSDETGYITFPVGAPDRLVIEFDGSKVGPNAPSLVEATGLKPQG